MVAPIIEILSVSRYKIGRNVNVDKSNVTFRYDQDLVQWEARADGQGVGQGLLVGSGVNASLLTLKQVSDMSPSLSDWISDFPNLVDVKYGETSFVVDDEELTWGDKPYTINIYGKNENGEWTSFGKVNLLDNPTFENGLWSKYGVNGNVSLVTGMNGLGNSARIDVTGASGTIGIRSNGTMDLKAGETITISFVARANRTLALNYSYMMTNQLSNTSLPVMTLSAEWKGYEMTWTVPVGKSATDYGIMFTLYAGRNGVTLGDWVEIDDVGIVKGG